MDKKVIIGIVIAAAIVGAGIFAVANNSSDSKSNTSPTPTPTLTSTPTPTSAAATVTPTPASPSPTPAASTTITYNGSGFSPSTLTVKSGTIVTVKNNSSSALQFNSDPHPSHTDNPELNIGSVSEGGSRTFTATAKGTWGYHNHLDSSQTGTIKVE